MKQIIKLFRRALFFIVTAWMLTSFKGEETTWVAIGDSITYLNDHPDETSNRITKGYLTLVTEQFPGLKYINKGFNGWTSGNIADRINDLGLVKADVYSVFLGTNDWGQGRPVGSFDDYRNDKGNISLYGSYRIIIDKLHSLNPGAKILLITPMQRADFVYINDAKNNATGSYQLKNGQNLVAFAQAINAIGAYEHIPVVDLYHNKALKIDNMVKFKRLKDPKTGSYINYKYPESTKIPFNPLTDEYPYPREAINLTYDGLHPSDKGYAIIAKNVITNFKHFDLLNGDKAAGVKAITATANWENYISLDAYSKPFWMTDTITDETVQVIRDENDIAGASLLFRAKKILSVKSANYSKVFIKGKDWKYKNGKLVFGPGSTVPFFHKEDLVFDKAKPGRSMGGKTPGTFIFFNEGAYFSSKQIAVTYIKDKTSEWTGPIPEFAAATLPNTLSKLKNGVSLKIAFYGNSIEVGYNASGLEKVPPYMPTWPELVIYNLKKTYSTNIVSVNKSVAGRLAQWGKDSVSNKIVAENPDLVIIGFGMNDGTFKVAPEIYRQQIKYIVDAVRGQNPAAEFILITPMLANPLSDFSGFQTLYKAELDKLTRKGVVIADLTGVHRELLKYKTYQDMTGNNINHPNDYLARWYAQVICGLLIKPGIRPITAFDRSSEVNYPESPVRQNRDRTSAQNEQAFDSGHD